MYYKAMFVYKSISGNNSLLEFCSNSQYNLRNESLQLPQKQTSLSKTTILYQGVKVWYELPRNKQHAISPGFQEYIKESLIVEANGQHKLVYKMYVE